MTGPIYTCSCYESRPAGCVRYPWEDAQILFPECQFVENGKVTPFEMVAKSKGEQGVAEFCRGCGRCCFAWQKQGDRYVPVRRCASLQIADQSDASPEHKVFFKIRRTINFS